MDHPPLVPIWLSDGLMICNMHKSFHAAMWQLTASREPSRPIVATGTRANMSTWVRVRVVTRLVTLSKVRNGCSG